MGTIKNDRDTTQTVVSQPKQQDLAKLTVDSEVLDVYNEERLVSKFDKENLKGKQ